MLVNVVNLYSHFHVDLLLGIHIILNVFARGNFT